jgi:hypothetical protein
MKIQILEKCYTGTSGNMFAGEQHDLNDEIAEKLIARGFAEKVKSTKTKSDRAVKKLSFPESE